MQTAAGKVWTLSELVPANLARIRKIRRLTVRQLSERLTEIGAPMLPSGITNVEKKKRSVSVEDLMSFAAALEASPADFFDAPGNDRISVAPEIAPVQSITMRNWIAGTWTLAGGDESIKKRQLEAAPEWFRDVEERKEQTFRHPAKVAISDLGSFVTGAILHDDGVEPALLAESLRDRLKTVAAYVNLLADEVERRAGDGR